MRELSIFFSLFQMNIHYYCEIETSRPNLRLYLFATLQLKAQELPRQTVSVIKYVSRRFIIDGQRVSQPWSAKFLHAGTDDCLEDNREDY